MPQTTRRNASVPPGQGVSISDAIGKYYGSLPKVSRLTADGNPLVDGNMLEPESRAPRPAESQRSSPFPDVSDDEDPRTPDIPPTVGTGAPSELEPEFVGHVHCEEEMEDQCFFYRPSSAKRVLVVDKEQN